MTAMTEKLADIVNDSLSGFTAQAAREWILDCDLSRPSDAIEQLTNYGLEVHNGNELAQYFAYKQELADEVREADMEGDECALREFIERADGENPTEAIRTVLKSLKDEDFEEADDDEDEE